MWFNMQLDIPCSTATLGRKSLKNRISLQGDKCCVMETLISNFQGMAYLILCDIPLRGLNCAKVGAVIV
jgi:hypothetical protein